MLQWFQFFLSSENVICTLLNKQMTINHIYIPNKQCRYNVNINNPYEKIETLLYHKKKHSIPLTFIYLKSMILFDFLEHLENKDKNSTIRTILRLK